MEAPHLDLSSTTGAYLIGVFFEVWLFGFTSLQTWYYFQHYPWDSWKIKTLVVSIWSLECLHAAFSCHAAYFWLVLNYLNPPALGISVWSADSALLIAGVLTFITHCFFCYRVWAVSGKSYIMPSIIFFFAFVAFCFDWTVFVLSVKEKTFANFGHAIEVTSSTALAVKVTTDVLIAVSLGFYLRKHRAGIPQMDHFANKVTFWAINVGCLTSIIDILVLAWSEGTSNLIFLALYTIVGNLYSNSLLATLNLREYARAQVLREDGTSLPLETVSTKIPGRESESRGTIPDLPKNSTVRAQALETDWADVVR